MLTDQCQNLVKDKVKHAEHYASFRFFQNYLKRKKLDFGTCHKLSKSAISLLDLATISNFWNDRRRSSFFAWYQSILNSEPEKWCDSSEHTWANPFYEFWFSISENSIGKVERFFNFLENSRNENQNKNKAKCVTKIILVKQCLKTTPLSKS